LINRWPLEASPDIERDHVPVALVNDGSQLRNDQIVRPNSYEHNELSRESRRRETDIGGENAQRHGLRFGKPVQQTS